MTDFDRKILALLQADARLTNNDLSERVNLSPSQCSRRRQRLEEDGFIPGYRALLDRDRLGFSLVSVISVTLATHNRDNARRFGELMARPAGGAGGACADRRDGLFPESGDAGPARRCRDFVNEELLPHDSVQHVKTAIVLETLKEGGALPL